MFIYNQSLNLLSNSILKHNKNEEIIMNTWKEECVLLLKNLGGHAYLKDIYADFVKHGTRPKAQSYDASIRAALE